MSKQNCPDCLVDQDGRPVYGIFNSPCQNINLDKTRLTKNSLKLPRMLSRFLLKEWQHFCVCLPELFMTFAVVDVKFLKSSWVNVVNRKNNTSFEHARKGVRLKTSIARELFNDRTSVRAKGYKIEIQNLLEIGKHKISIELKKSGNKPAVSADLICYHDLSLIEPLVVAFPLGDNRVMYSHKVVLPIEGFITVENTEYKVSKETGLAILDIHKAHYPRHTWWEWATCAGWDEAGRMIGVNLTRNVIRDDQRYKNENAVWVDGRLEYLDAAKFTFNKQNVMDPWTIRTKDGRVDLVFTPLGERLENIQLGVVKSCFHQPYGTFSGTLTFQNKSFQVNNLMGVCEDHTALW